MLEDFWQEYNHKTDFKEPVRHCKNRADSACSPRTGSARVMIWAGDLCVGGMAVTEVAGPTNHGTLDWLTGQDQMP